MQKKELVFLVFVFLFSNLPQPSPVLGQSDGCYWELISETPTSFTASTAPDATSSVSGTTVTINWEGLTTTHSWTYPGTSLKPGDLLEIEVSAYWNVSSGDALNSTGGLRTSFYFNAQNVSAGRNSISFNSEKSGSEYNSATFTVPSGSKEGATLSIYGFADAAVAGGRVDYKYVYKCATPTSTITPTRTRTSTYTTTSTKCPADTDAKKLEMLLAFYYSRIPKGIASSGEINNIYDFFGYPGYAEYTCGGYQSKVLDFLNSMKFSENPCVKEAMEKWDYGPIQAWFGYHQAVVLYPKGTDWATTGIVLDPWPKQQPEKYSIQEWSLMFSSTKFTPATYIGERVLGPTMVGIGASDVYRDGKAYPNVGGDYKDTSQASTTITFSEEEYRFIQSLPADKRDAFKQLPKPEQKNWLKIVMQGGEKVQKTIAHCPLYAYVTGPDGKRSGISGGEFFLELPDVSFMILELTDGTYYTEITYPENKGYKLELEATESGNAHVFTGHTLLLGDPTPPLQQYSFSTKMSEIYQIATYPLGSPMTWSDGSLAPATVTEISSEFLNSLPGLIQIGGQAFEEPQSSISRESGILGWTPPLWMCILTLLFGVIFFIIAVVFLINKLVKDKIENTGVAKQFPQKVNKPYATAFLIGLIVISCLISSCGIFGLIVNQRKNGTSDAAAVFDQTMTAIKATEMSLDQQFTKSAQALGSSDLTTPSPLDQPGSQSTQVENPLPVDTPLPVFTFTATNPAVPIGLPLTGNQYLDDHGIIDDFSSKALGWPEVENGKKILKYEEGGYSFQLLAKDDFDVVYLPVSFRPSEILFDVRTAEGAQDGTFGIFCQFQDQNNYYYIEFDMLGKSYVIAQSLNGEYIPLTAETAQGQYWHDADSFKDPTEVNRIHIGCYLGGIDVWVNDVLVDDIMINNPFTELGRTALFVYAYAFAGENGYKVFFDNLEAYQPMQ